MNQSHADVYRQYEERRQQECESAEQALAGLFGQLAELGIARIVINYDGYGDEGAIESVAAIGAGDRPVDLPKSLEDQLTHACLILLPQGWDINEGAFGHLLLDVTKRRLSLAHHRRHTNFTTESKVWRL